MKSQISLQQKNDFLLTLTPVELRRSFMVHYKNVSFYPGDVDGELAGLEKLMFGYDCECKNTTNENVI